MWLICTQEILGISNIYHKLLGHNYRVTKILPNCLTLLVLAVQLKVTNDLFSQHARSNKAYMPTNFSTHIDIKFISTYIITRCSVNFSQYCGYLFMSLEITFFYEVVCKWFCFKKCEFFIYLAYLWVNICFRAWGKRKLTCLVPL